MTRQETLAYRPKQGYGVIYKFTNSKDKSFVGKTVRSIEERAGYKGRYYEDEVAFYPALRKFGFDSFEVEILEEVPIAVLVERLQHWIATINCLVPNGYNVRPGYKSPHVSAIMKKRVCMYDLEGNLLKTYETMMDAANELGIKHKYIYRCAMHRRDSVQGYTFRYFLDKKGLFNTHPDPNHIAPVAKLDSEGIPIDIYSSLESAAAENGLDPLDIQKACELDLEIKATKRIYTAAALNTGWEFYE